jgi:hypothetical protein
MAGMEGMEYIKSRGLCVGNATYSIGLYHSAGGYVAFCDCHECTGHNMRSKPYSTQEAAIEECESLIREHHDGCHGSCPA